MEWITTAQLAVDSVQLAGLLPADTARIVGIPRSGMIPASIIAAHLHLPLWELTESGHFRRLTGGSRGFIVPSGPTVVIDDTVYGGGSMRRARDSLRGQPANFAAVYVRPDRAGEVDVYARTLDHRSHLLEWNFFNNHGLAAGGLAFDFDGILCHDPPLADADGGAGLERYRQWLIEARPLWLPRAQPVRLIVTARLERFRAETERWLARWNVRFERLEMCPARCASDRGDVAAWKAQHYRESATAFFVESDPGQAARIHELTGKQVICPHVARVWG
jgi:phosphoribosyl transferase-like protein